MRVTGARALWRQRAIRSTAEIRNQLGNGKVGDIVVRLTGDGREEGVKLTHQSSDGKA